MSDVITTEQQDDYLEHLFHDKPVASCSDCFMEQVENEFDADNYSNEEEDCVHDWDNSLCVKCGDVHEPDDFSGASY